MRKYYRNKISKTFIYYLLALLSNVVACLIFIGDFKIRYNIALSIMFWVLIVIFMVGAYHNDK
jgi:hypothetical protein